MSTRSAMTASTAPMTWKVWVTASVASWFSAVVLYAALDRTIRMTNTTPKAPNSFDRSDRFEMRDIGRERLLSAVYAAAVWNAAELAAQVRKPAAGLPSPLVNQPLSPGWRGGRRPSSGTPRVAMI